MTGRLFSRSCRRGAEDLPPPVLRAVQERAPGYLDAPTDWDLGPILSTWEAYARATPAEA